MLLKMKMPFGLRIVSLIVLPSFLIYTTGCTVTRLVEVSKYDIARQAASQNEAALQAGKSTEETCSMPWADCTKKESTAPKSEKIVGAVLLTGDAVKFDERGGKFIPPGAVEGLDSQGAPVSIPLDQISRVWVEKTEPDPSGVGITVLVLVILVAAIASSGTGSCPYVYSYDGGRYVFDAEPLGGSIAQGLEKTDYSRLEHLKPVDGRYRLLLRNETDETQYVDEVKLLIVDHPANQRIIPDPQGEMHAVETPVAPVSVVDEAGGDLMKFVSKQDNMVWQTPLPAAASVQGGDLRHHLTFTFPKPRGVKTAKLLVNAGTALWGSLMVKEMLDLRGDKVDAWYEAVNTAGPELFGLIEFNAREELYVLKVYVKEGGAWVPRGYIPGGGPVVAEDRVIPLDLSNVQGDTVEIRLNPPMGFWAIDYLGMEYGDHGKPVVQEAALVSAEDQRKNDPKDILASQDSTYVVMPEIGDWVRTDFTAPAQPEGAGRTVFLRTSGYYELHLSKDRPEQTALIQKFATTPGAIVEYSMERYREWRSRRPIDKKPGSSQLLSD